MTDKTQLMRDLHEYLVSLAVSLSLPDATETFKLHGDPQTGDAPEMEIERTGFSVHIEDRDYTVASIVDHQVYNAPFFVLSGTVVIPASYWEPEDADVIEIEVYNANNVWKAAEGILTTVLIQQIRWASQNIQVGKAEIDLNIDPSKE